MVADICPKCKNMDTVQRKASNHYCSMVVTEYFCPDCYTFWTARFELDKITVTREE